ncbi:14890_t:CDS:2, partial [Gigaspora rosea]
GLSHVIRHANPKHLELGDLVRILKILKKEFENIHTHDKEQQIKMIRTLGQLFDAMADCKVKDLKLAYQAKYACQALICILHDESPWKTFQKRCTDIFKGLTKLAGAITSIDPGRLPEAFEHFDKGFEGIEKVIKGAIDLVKEVHDGTDSIKQGLSFGSKRKKWYWALRYTDLFIQIHQFKDLERFIYNVQCFQTNDFDFLWGLCERLEQLALDPELNVIHSNAVDFLDYILNKICQDNDKNDWKYHLEQLDKVKNLRELASPPSFATHSAGEFNDDLDLYVKPRGKQKVPVIKSLDNERKMTFEDEDCDVEEVVNGFLKSKDKLAPDDKKILEKAIDEFLNSKDKISLLKTVNSFFALENQLALKDEKILDIAANQSLALKDKMLLEEVTNNFLSNSNSEIIKNTINDFLKSVIINDEDIRYLNIVINEYLTLKNETNFVIELNEFLAHKAKKILETTVKKIIASKYKKVLLILGIGGTGKSTFNRYLTRRLWQEYNQQTMPQSPIPLFIALARIGKMVNQDADLIEIYLKEECNLPIDMINNLRNEKFVFILDGYDEIAERDCQCYERNRFNKWNAKVIISCRPEYLGSGYEKMGFPKNGERGFQELTITPFSKIEIQQYINKYVNKGHSLHFDTGTYIQQIKKIPQLEDLISNPILLKITLIALPDIIKREATTALQINRINLYEEILKTWFDRAQQRLLTIQQIDEEKKAFRRLNLDDFSNSCLQFSKDFAAEMFKDNNKVVIEYNSNNSNWELFLGNEDAKHYLLRFSMPLIRRGTEYWFLHKSIRDYLIAMKFLESFKSTKLDITFFYKQSFASEPEVQQFVAEHIQQNMSDFKPKLLEFIESSKKDEHAQTASANAITILTLVAKLNQVNFQNVKLRNANLLSSSLHDANFKDADLTFANLQNTLLQGANLQNTTLQNANLQNANLQNATLQNANFQNADLQYAKLPSTSLQYANFKGANLSLYID